MSLCGLAEEMEVFGHEGGQFIRIVPEMVKQVLDGRPKFAERGVEAVPGDVLPQKLPESLDQVEVGRIGGQEQQGNLKFLGEGLHAIGALLAGIVEDDEDGDVGMRCPEFVEQLTHHLGIARDRVLDSDEGLIIGGVGPKHIEATPARVGLQFHRPVTLDPAVARHRLMQYMGGIHKIQAPRWP